jgi:hypothetical protein
MAQQLWSRPIIRRAHRYATAGLLVAWMCLAVFTLPDAVDAAAYLAGAGGHGTFTADYSNESCSYGTNGTISVCSTTTYGYLDPGHVSALWPGEVSGSFPVRTPLWTWGIGRLLLIDGVMAVIESLIVGFIDLGLVFVAYRGYRAWRSAKSGRTGGAPVAGAA